MAYNKKFNPDALPMHAEPDQAAQMIATAGKSGDSSRPSPPPKNAPQSSYNNKPTPPPPQQDTRPQGRRPTNPTPNPPRSPVYGNQGYGGQGGGYAPQQAPHGASGGQYGGQGGGQYGSYTNQGGGPGAYGGYGGGIGSGPHQGGRPDGHGGPPRAQTSPRPPGGPQGGPASGYGPRHDSLSAGSPHPASIPYRGPGPASPLPGSSAYHAPQPGGAPGPVPAQNIPPAGDSSLFSLFRAVDTRGTGQLSEEQLGMALKNGDYSSFDPKTVRMMISMFDHDRSGSVGFDEFQGLWGFLSAWRALFDRFDEDHSGHISYDEYSKALKAFGYHLSAEFIGTLYGLYDRPGPNKMSFDLFVQSCISLKRMTDVFKKFDTDRDGYVTLSFEEFLTEILNQQK